MECATLFTVGFARFVPVGALMLISDLPLKPGGVKTATSAAEIFKLHTKYHIEMGISILQNMQKDEQAGFGYHF